MISSGSGAPNNVNEGGAFLNGSQEQIIKNQRPRGPLVQEHLHYIIKSQ